MCPRSSAWTRSAPWRVAPRAAAARRPARRNGRTTPTWCFGSWSPTRDRRQLPRRPQRRLPRRLHADADADPGADSHARRRLPRRRRPRRRRRPLSRRRRPPLSRPRPRRRRRRPTPTPTPDAHANSDSDSVADTDANAIADTDSNADADADADPGADADAEPDSDANSKPLSRAHSDGRADHDRTDADVRARAELGSDARTGWNGHRGTAAGRRARGGATAERSAALGDGRVIRIGARRDRADPSAGSGRRCPRPAGLYAEGASGHSTSSAAS